MKGLNSAFSAVYWLLLALATVALVAQLALSVFGVVRFLLATGSRARMSRANQQLMLNDDFGFASLLPYRTGAKSHDPYLIYVQNTIMSGCFYLLSALVIALGLHLGLALSLYIYTVFRPAGQAPDDGPSFAPDANLIILATLVTVTCMVMTWIGGDMYTNGFTTNANSLAKRVAAFNAFVYGNAYADAPFLAKLLADDPLAALASVPASAGTDTLARAVFTINLWQYFRDRMPDAHPGWESVQTLFTVDALNDQRMDITPLVSASAFSSLPNRMFDVEGNLPLDGDTAEDVSDAVSSLMQRANQLLHALNPAPVQGAFGTYLFVRAAVLAVLVGGTLAFFVLRQRSSSAAATVTPSASTQAPPADTQTSAGTAPASPAA